MMNRQRRLLPGARVWAASVILFCALPACAQINNPAYADYFLVGRFGEICTMCEAVVLCESGPAIPEHASIPESGSFTVYDLQTRTFWSQVGTIWEWFVANFSERAVDGHSRPVRVIEVSDGRWDQPIMREARISLDPARIAIADYYIDRVDRSWHKGDVAVGYCQRLPLWESLDVIQARTGGEAGS